MVYVDRKIRNFTDADELLAVQEGDVSRAEQDRRMVSLRHGEGEVDMSTMPEWTQPTDEMETM
ncbi:hypothetical protein OC861_007002, partial [Tilletia horrida]